MGNERVGGIYVVAATKNGRTEYWAAATTRGEAVAAVERELVAGWNVTLTNHRLTPQRMRTLKLRPNGVHRLKGAP
jgi:hypothetical protein